MFATVKTQAIKGIFYKSFTPFSACDVSLVRPVKKWTRKGKTVITPIRAANPTDFSTKLTLYFLKFMFRSLMTVF